MRKFIEMYVIGIDHGYGNMKTANCCFKPTSFLGLFALQSSGPAVCMVPFALWQSRRPCPGYVAFGVIFLLCGLLYLFAVPMLQVSDEPQHYLRSYEIATGGSPQTLPDGSVGDYMPGNLIPEQFADPASTSYGQILSAMDERIDRENLQPYAFPGAEGVG